jgi:hypothetical protein
MGIFEYPGALFLARCLGVPGTLIKANEDLRPVPAEYLWFVGIQLAIAAERDKTCEWRYLQCPQYRHFEWPHSGYTQRLVLTQSGRLNEFVESATHGSLVLRFWILNGRKRPR